VPPVREEVVVIGDWYSPAREPMKRMVYGPPGLPMTEALPEPMLPSELQGSL
jgi:hypothetical protein